MTDLHKEIPIIIVDDREKRSGILAHFDPNSIAVQIKRLQYGDYRIEPQWGIERKTAVDFNQSIISGRLFRQLYHLKRVYRQPILIIEGNPYQTHIHIDPNAVRGALLTIQAVWYLPAIHSRNLADTCRILTTLAQYAGDQQDDTVGRAGYKPKRISTRQIYILCGLPGIGPTLARRLLKKFKTIAGIISAGAKEMAEVDGIGPSTALRIRRILDHPYSRQPW